jgi:hypothetical protein
MYLVNCCIFLLVSSSSGSILSFCPKFGRLKFGGIPGGIPGKPGGIGGMLGGREPIPGRNPGGGTEAGNPDPWGKPGGGRPGRPEIGIVGGVIGGIPGGIP